MECQCQHQTLGDLCDPCDHLSLAPRVFRVPCLTSLTCLTCLTSPSLTPPTSGCLPGGLISIRPAATYAVSQYLAGGCLAMGGGGRRSEGSGGGGSRGGVSVGLLPVRATLKLPRAKSRRPDRAGPSRNFKRTRPASKHTQRRFWKAIDLHRSFRRHGDVNGEGWRRGQWGQGRKPLAKIWAA